jgi:WD40 repeat protein
MAGDRIATVDFGGDLDVYDTELEPVGPTTTLDFTTVAVDLASDGSFAVVGGARSPEDESQPPVTTITKVSLPDGAVSTIEAGDQGYVNHLALDPDEQRVVGVTDLGALIVVDVAAGRVEQVIEHLDPMNMISVTWAPDGRHVWVGGQAANLIELDTATWKETRRVPIGPDVAITSIFPDGDRLLVSEETGSVHAVDITTFEEVGTPLTSNATQLQAVTVTPDGSRVAAASRDGALRLWDAASGRPVGPPLGGHDEQSRSILATVSPDGTPLVFTEGADGRLLRWELDPVSWARTACEVAGRNLSAAEWDQFLPGKPYRATCPEWPAA